MQYNRRHLTFNSKKLFIRFVNFFQKNRNVNCRMKLNTKTK